jgi:N-acyl-D-amino-acid deacylase
MTEAPARADLVIRNAILIDGTGAPRRPGGVAVSGGRIVFVGDAGGIAAPEEVDAGGNVLAPGFIDVHTHDDRALCETPLMVMKASQGVTTVVAGNCGISLAPLVREGFPPAPLHLLGGGAFLRYGAFGDWVEHLSRAPAAVNSALLVGHTPVRHRRMGACDATCGPECGHGGKALERAATDRELAEMEADVEQAMREGAIGVSTGLDYAEAVKAPTAEVTALARAAARHGGLYAAHTRDYFVDIEGALEEAIAIARTAGLPLVISHHQVSGAANFGRSKRTLPLIAKAMETHEIGLDVYPYNASSKTLDPQRCQPGVRVLITWSEPHPEMASKEISEIAAGWGVSNVEAAGRLTPAGAVYFQLDEADVRRILAFPGAMVGSDGIPFDRFPHPRLWGTFPRVLGHYARDLGLFSLEEAVHRMTGVAAATFGLAGRGVIAVGAAADLVLFDPATVIDRATFTDPKQPAGGILGVWVNGGKVREGMRATGARPGRVLFREGTPLAA